jgi:hypothetical protein
LRHGLAAQREQEQQRACACSHLRPSTILRSRYHVTLAVTLAVTIAVTLAFTLLIISGICSSLAEKDGSGR